MHHRRFQTVLTVFLIAVLIVPAVLAQDRAAIVQRLRAELATLLKKNAADLPVDKPVTQLGADDLTVVEWQMAAEEAFRVNIPEDKLFEKKTRTRKDLTISSMAAVVADSPKWPAGKTK